ncbi:ABC transporter ATP-binding protein [Isoptericola halotolerans]|uniref:ABC-2 type transport system ATP-binding protein n=2 Tax=Isoptericola halotolerans TaxID=300560 RepID=A0ABX2A8A1_9MICO|nr:ABC transporter ATP-binding protein [Isoptericola halotolerans]NOV98886.1 ABC-2 type transport system ATP-binding protein [Isoptericola halotolerans]
MSDDVLVVEGVTKRFGAVTANAAISIRVRAGEVVGLLGHNGAGKTTLVSQIVGLLRPDAGEIRVAGVDAVAHPGTARRLVALQAQGQVPLDGLTPRTAVELAGRLRGLPRREARRAAERLAVELDITEWIDQRALPEGRGLSGGVRRLAGFAMTVAAPAPLVVLDEPTNDVDAARRRRLWDAVRRLRDRGAGVLLVTHNVLEAEKVVDDLVVLDRGQVVAAGSPARLASGLDDGLRLEVTLPPGGDDPTPDVPFAVRQRVRAGRRVLLVVPADEASPAVTWAASLRDTGVVDGYTLGPATLEDAYLALTESTGAAGDELTEVTSHA